MTEIRIPRKLIPLFTPKRGDLSYRIMWGGRGSAKSRTAATMALVWAATEKLKVLCIRQFQNSVEESFYAELVGVLEDNPELEEQYTIGATSLASKSGSEFIFKGLDRNINSIKSMPRIDLTIVEEAEQIKDESWRKLIPTVRRQPKSEIWVITNPEIEDSPTDKRFIKNTPTRGMAVEINYSDNPFFPEGLEEERLNDLKLYPDGVYRHIWHGAYLAETEYCVYRRAWFDMRYDNAPALREFDYIIHSWDTAYKAQDHNDPSACSVWGIKADKAYLLHVINKRMEYPELKREIQNLAVTYPPSRILIEDKASGQSLIQELRMSTQLPIEAVSPEGDKRTRAVASTQVCADSRILLPRDSEWLKDFEKQLFFFTGDPKLDKLHDDMVDSFSQFINWFKGNDKDTAYKQHLLKALGR
jgi:PBSX family phage terminase large subunit